MSATRIMIVEDEMIIAMDLQETLIGFGFEVVGAVPSAEEAIELAGRTRPDLALMDINLQGEMSGLDAAAILREQFDIPTLLLTAYVSEELLNQAKRCDALGYLLKPYDERELGVALNMAIHRAKLERELRDSLQRLQQLNPGVGPGEEGGGNESTPREIAIRTFGGIELQRGEHLLPSSELTRFQRDLLGLIISAPHGRIARDQVEVALWPDTTASKARSNFDSLLLRLRKSFQEYLEMGEEKQYISFRRGILSLENCNIDLNIFLRAATRGLDLKKRGETAAAVAELETAVNLYGGEFLSGVTSYESIDALRHETSRLFVGCCRHLARIHEAAGRVEETTALLMRGLKFEPTNDALTMALYLHLTVQGDFVAAKRILRQYSEALLKEGFSSKEIERIIAGMEERSRRLSN